MPRARILRTLFAALALAFFVTPLALRAAGVHAHEFENHKLAAAPRVSQGWRAFGQATAYITDHMPLREQAVRANTRILRDVFDTTPRYDRTRGGDRALPFAAATDQGGRALPTRHLARDAGVVEGSRGWLFLTSEFHALCNPAIPAAEAAARWSELVTITRRSGRRAVMLAPSDKGSVYPERVPASDSGPCVRAGRNRLWSLLEGLRPPPGVIGLRTDSLRRKRTAGDNVYGRNDSHWTSLGAVGMPVAALRAIGGGVQVQPGEVVPLPPVKLVGDLSFVIGAPERIERQRRAIRRAPGAPQVPGRTLVIIDSYGAVAEPLLFPYFKHIRFIYWTKTTPVQRLRAIAASDNVIYETVEREFAGRTGPGGPADAAFVELLRRALPPKR